jgi:hypothetical protein
MVIMSKRNITIMDLCYMCCECPQIQIRRVIDHCSCGGGKRGKDVKAFLAINDQFAKDSDFSDVYLRNI